MSKKNRFEDYNEIQKEFMKMRFDYSFSAAIHLDCLNAATILSYFSHNTTFGQPLKNGKGWTYGSVSRLAGNLPFTQNQILTAISLLEKEGLVIPDFLSQDKFDRSKWYCVTQKGLDLNNGVIFIQKDSTRKCLLLSNGKEVFYDKNGEKTNSEYNSFDVFRDTDNYGFYIYLIRSESENQCKIGYSKDPKRRLTQIKAIYKDAYIESLIKVDVFSETETRKLEKK